LPVAKDGLDVAQRTVLQALRQKYPTPAQIKVFRVLPGGGRQQIPDASGSALHRVSWDDLDRIDDWLAKHPLIGPGHGYSVQVFVENAHGTVTKAPRHILEVPMLVGVGEAAAVALQAHTSAAAVAVESQRLSAQQAVADASQVVEREQQALQEAMKMAQSPDPVQQAAAQVNIQAATDRLQQVMQTLTSHTQGLNMALSRFPTPGAPPPPAPASNHGAGTQLPSPIGGPMLPSAFPQVVHLPGYGPMANINGQLVPISQAAPAPGSAGGSPALEREVLELRLKLASQEAALAHAPRSAIDPGVQAQIDALKQANADALRRAEEAERRAEKAREDAERDRRESATQAKLDALTAELAKLREGGGAGKSDAQLEMMKFNASQQLEMQKLAMDVQNKAQVQVQALQTQLFDLVKMGKETGSNDQIRQVTQSMGEVVNLVTGTLAQATRIAAMGGPPAPDKKPLWLDPLNSLIGTVGSIGTMMLTGQVPQQMQPQQQGYQQQGYQQQALPPGPQGYQQQALPPAPPPPALPPPAPPASEFPAAPPAAPQAPVADPAAAPPPGPPAITAADGKAAGELLDAARMYSVNGDLESAFRTIDQAVERYPNIVLEPGEDELRAGRRILAGFWPDGVTQERLVGALVSVKGVGVIARLAAMVGPTPVPPPMPEPTGYEGAPAGA
jgi:hypothetical protein